MTGLTDTLNELNAKPWLMKVLWRGDVSDRIAETYQALSEAIQLCKASLMSPRPRCALIILRGHADWNVDRHAPCDTGARRSSPDGH